MQLATIREGAREVAVALDPPRGLVRLTELKEPIEGGVLDVLAAVPPAVARAATEALRQVFAATDRPRRR